MALAEDYYFKLNELKLGNLEVRLAENNLEIDAAQYLRFKVFYEEMNAKPSENIKKTRRDIDPFDHFFDHLLVIDNGIKGSFINKVVGTYRLNRGDKSKKEKFYTAGEYNIDKLINYSGNILELGRSCVHSDYRDGKTMHLLWKGIANYVFHYDIKIMFGCASFPGIDVIPHKEALSYLSENYLAPSYLRPYALKGRYINMKYKEKKNINNVLARKTLPPLIKGYLRLGAYIGKGAVLDDQFNTLDVCIVLPTEKVSSRYLSHYDRNNK